MAIEKRTKELSSCLLNGTASELSELLKNGADMYDIYDPLGKMDPCLFIPLKNLSKNNFQEMILTLIEYEGDLLKEFNRTKGPMLSFLDQLLSDAFREIASLDKDSDLYDTVIKNVCFVLETCLQYEKNYSGASLANFLELCSDVPRLSESKWQSAFLDIVTILSRYGEAMCNWHYVTTRGMSPLHLLTAITSLNADTLEHMIQLAVNMGGNLNARDIFGQTPLHMATAWKNSVMIRVLINKGANPNLSDNFGWTPICIAIKGSRFLKADFKFTKRDVQMYDMNTLGALYFPERLSLSAEELNLELLRPVKTHCESDCLTCFGRTSYHGVTRKYLADELSFFDYFVAGDLDKFKEYRGDAVKFIRKLLTCEHVGAVDFTKPVNRKVKNQVTTLIHRAVKFICVNYPLFSCEVQEAGSVAEGTKIRAPDEFDVNIVLKTLKGCVPCCREEVRYTTVNRDEIFIPADKRNSFLIPPWNEFFRYSLETNQKCLSPTVIQNRLGQLMAEALSSKDVWEGLSLYWRSTNVVVSDMVAINLIWTGPEYPDMPISLDLMAMIELDSWPPDILNPNCSVIPENIRTKGCIVMIKDGKFKLTASAHELFFLKHLPTVPKLSYVLCKILLDVLGYTKKLKKLNSFFFFDLIPTSYEVKNALFGLCDSCFREDSDFLVDDTVQADSGHSVPKDLTRTDVEDIKSFCLRLIDSISLCSYREVGSSSTLYCKDHANCVVDCKYYKCPRFMFAPTLAMSIRVASIHDLNIRGTMKELLL